MGIFIHATKSSSSGFVYDLDGDVLSLLKSNAVAFEPPLKLPFAAEDALKSMAEKSN